MKLVGARLIDGTGAAPMENATLILMWVPKILAGSVQEFWSALPMLTQGPERGHA